MKIWHYLILILVPLSGGVLGYYTRLKDFKNMKLLLGFAGAYLLSVVLIHLIPHIYREANILSGVFLLSGFLFQLLIERFSHGVEHGHFHEDTFKGKKQKWVPLSILLSLALHSFMEGIPLGSEVFEGNRAQLSFIFGIVLHEFPAAFALTTILKSQNLNGKVVLLFAFIYASMASLGALMAGIFGDHFHPHVFEYVMAFVVGTFLHIATTILFENSDHHRYTVQKILAMLVGVAVAVMVSLM
jgi:zinc and cadmium transporter